MPFKLQSHQLAILTLLKTDMGVPSPARSFHRGRRSVPDIVEPLPLRWRVPPTRPMGIARPARGTDCGCCGRGTGRGRGIRRQRTCYCRPNPGSFRGTTCRCDCPLKPPLSPLLLLLLILMSIYSTSRFKNSEIINLLSLYHYRDSDSSELNVAFATGFMSLTCCRLTRHFTSV